MITTSLKGMIGENFAADKLIDDGYMILEKNFRNGKWEVDIIAQKDDIIAFIEVKTRSENGFSTPAQSLLRGQRRRIVLSAVEYLKRCGLYNNERVQPRFDIFEIETDMSDSSHIIRYSHMIGAFGTEGLNVFV